MNKKLSCSMCLVRIYSTLANEMMPMMPNMQISEKNERTHNAISNEMKF